MIGGLNTYEYVESNPLRFIDLDGLVKWTGSMWSASVVPGIGAGGILIELRSECINGKRGYVKARGIGVGFGVGVRLPKIPGRRPSGTFGNVVFDDFLIDVIDTNMFNGRFEAAGASAVVIGGVGHQLIRCGRARARVTGTSVGLDVGATGFRGSCTVLESRIEDCNDCNQ